MGSEVLWKEVAIETKKSIPLKTIRKDEEREGIEGDSLQRKLLLYSHSQELPTLVEKSASGPGVKEGTERRSSAISAS